MLAQLAVTMLAVTGSTSGSRGDSTAAVQVRIDSARHEVVVTVRPIHIPEATLYNHHATETRLQFLWPVRGWARGYRIEVLDSAGRVLPREVLHHAGVVNLDRRQLPYPMAERLFAAGRETPPLMMPASMGVPMTPDQRLVLYYALVNPTPYAIDGAALCITIAWTPDRTDGPRDVFPLFLDANPKIGGSRSFDVPPGVSITSAEFTLPMGGHVRALGGHVHDYAVELRLEDAETNKVLVRLKTKRDADGRLISVSTARFIFKRDGLRLAADHRYRVVSVYDNPTCATIALGAMAFMAGPFIPDDIRRWPAIDPTDPIYQQDHAGLLGVGEHAGHHHEMDVMGDEPVSSISSELAGAAAAPAARCSSSTLPSPPFTSHGAASRKPETLAVSRAPRIWGENDGPLR